MLQLQVWDNKLKNKKQKQNQRTICPFMNIGREKKNLKKILIENAQTV